MPSLRAPEIIALLRASEGSRDPERDRAIVLLLVDTGVCITRHLDFVSEMWTSPKGSGRVDAGEPFQLVDERARRSGSG